MNILIIPFLKSLESTSILSNAKSQFPVAEPPLCLSRPRPRAGSDSLAPGSNSSLLKPKTMVATPEQVMKLYMSKLTPYEHHEIFNYPQIYFIGANDWGRDWLNDFIKILQVDMPNLTNITPE